MKDYVEIKNATIHNLKGIDVKIPKNKLTIITGLSPTVAVEQRIIFFLIWKELLLPKQQLLTDH